MGVPWIWIPFARVVGAVLIAVGDGLVWLARRMGAED